ncbi:nucleoside monophosphate kinase [Candidatus Daviesbacteria bacterium]|nr:nucleoside monophosphate kinase [Candidatus Daviesbacteria bacterium]
MKILILGLPGSGKTTQAKKIAEDLKICFINFGQILREMIAADGPLGKKIKEKVEKGFLVEDELVAQIIKDRLKQPDCQYGFVIDGYPRSLAQIHLFDPKFDYVIHLNVSEEKATKRMLSRGRLDDKDRIIATRFKAQKRRIVMLLNYYISINKLIEIDGEQSIEEVHRQIKKSL